MKKFIFSGTTKANYALLAETSSAFFLMRKNRAAETLQFSAAITYQLFAGRYKRDRQFVGSACRCAAHFVFLNFAAQSAVYFLKNTYKS